MKEIKNLLTLDEAHAGFEKAIKDVDISKINEVYGHSLWQLLEHICIGQADLLRYMTDSNYSHDMKWPDDYWPKSEGSAADWKRSVEQFREDHKKIVSLVEGDLQRAIPSTNEHSLLRELLLVADHNAYHIGQMVLVRKIMGNW